MADRVGCVSRYSCESSHAGSDTSSGTLSPLSAATGRPATGTGWPVPPPRRSSRWSPARSRTRAASSNAAVRIAVCPSAAAPPTPQSLDRGHPPVVQPEVDQDRPADLPPPPPRLLQSRLLVHGPHRSRSRRWRDGPEAEGAGPFRSMPSQDLGVISTSLFRFKGPLGAHWETISAGAILVTLPGRDQVRSPRRARRTVRRPGPVSPARPARPVRRSPRARLPRRRRPPPSAVPSTPAAPCPA